MNEIKFYRGDSYPIEIVIWENSREGKLLDITGSTFLLTVSSEQNPKDITNQLFSISGTIINYDQSRVQFEPSALNTNLKPGEYWYDITMINNLKHRTIVKDRFIILQDITK